MTYSSMPRFPFFMVWRARWSCRTLAFEIVSGRFDWVLTRHRRRWGTDWRGQAFLLRKTRIASIEEIDRAWARWCALDLAFDLRLHQNWSICWIELESKLFLEESRPIPARKSLRGLRELRNRKLFQSSLKLKDWYEEQNLSWLISVVSSVVEDDCVFAENAIVERSKDIEKKPERENLWKKIRWIRTDQFELILT